MSEKHLIIGANGPIGKEIYSLLKESNKEVYRFGRSKIDQEDYICGNALNINDVLKAVKGKKYIYITIGLKYDHKIWEKQWPIIIDHIITAAKKENSKIIFFDNVYIYGPQLAVPITEMHEISPISKKGKVRRIIHDKLTSVMNELDIMIVRAPDFFGGDANSSLIYNAFLENMIKDKKPLFLGNDTRKHSYGYTKDLARATVLLASDSKAYNQVWHLPCYQTNSIYEILDMYNQVLKKDFKLTVVGKKMHALLGIFMPMLKEVYEMRYQFETDYVLSFEKFSKKYPGFIQTTFKDAITETVLRFKNDLIASQ